jgi:hypothetical protein
MNATKVSHFFSEKWIEGPDNCFTVAADELVLSGAGPKLKTGYFNNQQRKPNEVERKRVNHPNSEVGC